MALFSSLGTAKQIGLVPKYALLLLWDSISESACVKAKQAKPFLATLKAILAIAGEDLNFLQL